MNKLKGNENAGIHGNIAVEKFDTMTGIYYSKESKEPIQAKHSIETEDEK